MSEQDKEQISSGNFSVHDHQLLAYEVFSTKREICLHTVYWLNDQPTYTDIIFSDVLAYQFESDTFETVLFDIEKTDFAAHYRHDRELFQRLKNYGWPPIKYDAETELFTQLRKRGVTGYSLQSSCGLCGWVWAKTMIIKNNFVPNEPT